LARLVVAGAAGPAISSTTPQVTIAATTMQAATKPGPNGVVLSLSLIRVPDPKLKNLLDQGLQKSPDRRGSYPQAPGEPVWTGAWLRSEQCRSAVDL